MTEEIRGVLFSDGRDRVFFHPPIAYSDGHGFHHQVDVVSGPFKGSIEATSYAGLAAFAEFRKQLVELHESLKGDAGLPPSYENIAMVVRGDGLGHLEVCGEVRAGNVMAARLSFGFALDQTFLPEIIKAIDRIFLD